ncbi:MAG: hypothetical protein U9N53_06700 [Bacteroidota bacterium]|nr:hypothetical protein [Bacteroidota bacterium]
MRKFVSILLLFAYLVLLLVPSFPYFYSLAYQHLNNYNSISHSDLNFSDSMIGDECYLKAILDRASEDSKTSKAPTPVNPGPEVNNLIFLTGDVFSYQYIDTHAGFQYLQYSFSIKEAIREIPSPPPKYIV